MAGNAVFSTAPNLQHCLAAPFWFHLPARPQHCPVVQSSASRMRNTFVPFWKGSQFSFHNWRPPRAAHNLLGCSSRTEPGRPREPVLPSQLVADDADSVEAISIVTWNVVTLAADNTDDLAQGDKGAGLNSSGKMKFLAQRFSIKQFDVIALQETRIPVTGQSKVADYEVIGLTSRSWNGGLHLWLHKRLKSEVLWHKGFGQRVLAVAVQFHGVDWLFIVVHAPHDVSPANAHAIFRNNLESALVCAKPRQRLMVLGDYNLRVKNADPRVVGPYALSDPVPGSVPRTEALVQLLGAHKLLLSNTWVSTMDQSQHTWRHPKGALAQIDYIAVQQKDYHLCMTCSVTSSAHFAVDHPSDHDLVILRLCLHGPSTTSRKSNKPLKFINEEHAVACKASLINAPPPPRGEGQSASQWWQSTIDWVASAMAKTKPKRSARPKKDWISTSTWKGMQYMAELRKYYSLRHTSLNRFLLYVCFLAWRTRPADFMLDGWFQHFVVYRSVVKLSQFLALHKCKKLVRRWQKLDRNEWLAQQCDSLNERWSTNKRAFYSLLRNFRPRDPKTSPPHLLADGTIASTPELHAQAQCNYWCQKLNGVPSMACKSLMDEVVVAPPPSIEELDAARALLPLDTVRSLVQHLNPRKSAPDRLSPELYKELATWITPALHEHLVEVLATGVSPESWKGSQLVGIPKKTTGDTLALRPISLLLTSAKLFGRIILDRISACMLLPSHQLGVGQVTGVDFAHVSLNEMLCFAKHHRVCAGVLFVDMVGAFDSIHRELVFGPGPVPREAEPPHSEHMEEVLPCGVPLFRALEAHEMFQRHVLPLVHQPGVPEQVRRILTETNSNAWMQLPTVPGWTTLQQIATRTGVKQGGVYSPLAYVLYQSAAEAEFERCIRESGLDLVLPRVSLWGTDPDRAMASGSHSSLDAVTEEANDNVPFNLIAFFDDIAIMRWSDDPELMVDMVAKLTDIGIKVFKQYNLVFNLSVGKTEVSFRFNSRTSELHAGFATTAQECGRSGMAVAARKEAAKEGVKNIGPLLKHVDILPHIKVRLVATFSHSRLLVGLPTKGQLLPQQLQSLAHTYYWCLHRCYETVSDKPSYTHNQLVAKTMLPPFEVLLHVRRLMFFQRLVKTSIVLPTATIAIAAISPKSWCSVLLQSLTCAQNNIASLANVPPPTLATLPIWAAVVVLLQGEWKSYLQSWRAKAVLDATAFAHAAAAAGLELQQPDAKFECAHCNKSFAKPVSLAAHMKAAHPEHTNSVAMKVVGTKCVHCGAHFTHRKRLLVHLRGYALCWEHYNGLPSLSAEELRIQSRLYSESQQVTRLAPPRRGPKRVVHGLPVTETLAPWIYVPNADLPDA
eukprot:5150073-Amphidinium_carterae.2